MAAPALSLSVRLQNALCQPVLQTRIDEITRILNESSSKDAGLTFRTTVESIFGLNGQAGWGLRTITRSALPREFDQMRVFLGALGPLLSLAYRLANDPFLGFEFPVAWLPMRSRVEIEEGIPSVFYANKVQNPGPGKPPTNILLNAFEYYLFHFAYFLVGANNQRWSLSWSTAGDALYPTLLEDYLTTFLPCDNSVPPGPPSPPVSPRGVLSPVPPRSANPNLYLSSLVSPIGGPRPPMRTPAVSPHGYLRMDGSVAVGHHMTSSPLVHHHHHNPNPQLNTWTSQILVQVVMEMWVNQCLPPPTRTPARPVSPTTPQTHTGTAQYSALHEGSVFSEYIPLDYRPYWHLSSAEVLVPSSDHVRVVRILVKHLHFFTNSVRTSHPSALDDLRKNVWTMYRKSLYQFLCHTFSHWPLDSSFRLVLETWLSYIQPWRYTQATLTTSPIGSGMELEGQRIVEEKWESFVAENLLFYSVLFHRLAIRLFRLDLSAPRNALILFRVTKVFSQINLNRFIRKIEEALDDPHFVHRSLLSGTTSTLGHSTGGLAVNTDPYSTRSLASVARSHILEMEGPSHAYLPMFGQANISMVESLLKYVRRAHDAVYSEQQQNQQNNGSVGVGGWKDGWFGSIWKSLFETSTPTEDEATAEDIRKTVIHLDTAFRQLSAVFDLLLPLDYGNVTMNGVYGSSIYGGGSPDPSRFQHHQQLDTLASPHHITSPSGPVLSNYGRHQLISGLRRRDLKYEGDPDLKPICTYELPFLVRWLYTLAVIINTKYGSMMKDAFARQDILGYLSRLVLKSPETIYEYHKDPCDSPTHTRVPRHLPPRVSFRFQASKHVIGYECAIGLLLYALGLWGLLFKMLVILAVMVLIPAYILHRYFMRSQEPFHQAAEQEEVVEAVGGLDRDNIHHRTPLLNRSPAQ